MAGDNETVISYSSVYTSEQEALINSEFIRLKDECYLEHAGTTLYSEKQISNVFSDLTLNIYGNPHAKNTSSKQSEDAVDQIRYRILEHFNTNASEYSVVFTSGATAALKLVGEIFTFQNQSYFGYLEDNHTSVLGMREYAKNIISFTPHQASKLFTDNCEEKTQYQTNSLFVYPAQCNFSGRKYSLSWINKVQNGILNRCNEVKETSNWFCMVDAASYTSTNVMDLSKYKPDFMCVSFYKIFGYPSGLGALLVKNSSSHVLNKRYFGGGTVLMAISSERVHVPRKNLHEWLEDGTLNFLSIMALKHGFDTLERLSLTMKLISKHTFNLARYVYKNLEIIRHGNGEPVAVLYHDGNFDSIDSQGGIVNFNLLRPTGEYIGYAEVLHISNLFNIHLRTGCFCNPGACQRHLKLTTDDVKHHFESGHVCGDQNDLIDGHPTGSVRISFGYMSTKEDADTFLSMVQECFVVKSIIPKISCKLIYPADSISTKVTSKTWKGVVQEIYLYPIKSCAAFKVKRNWQIMNTGLKYDREWMIVNAAGVCITQKQTVRLCLIKPSINLERETLELQCEGFSSINLSLNMARGISKMSSSKCQSKVCNDRVIGWDCGNEVANWLSDALDFPGLRLLRQCSNRNEINRNINEGKATLSLTNQAQFLLINTASVQWLSDCIRANNINTDNLIKRFRPNLVVLFPEPLVENKCSKIQIGKLILTCDGRCTRCQMVCIDQATGEKSPEPLKTLSKVFNGKISFGIYLSNLDVKQDFTINVNEHVDLFT